MERGRLDRSRFRVIPPAFRKAEAVSVVLHPVIGIRVRRIRRRRRLAIHVVPPAANLGALVEQRAVRTVERLLLDRVHVDRTLNVANTAALIIRVKTGIFVLARERGLRCIAYDRVVNTWKETGWN